MKFLTIPFILYSVLSLGQSVPTPASDPGKKIAIKGATIHVGNGEILHGHTIMFEKGKITDIAPDTDDLPDNIEIIYANEKHVYPGFIAPNTILGLNEIDAVRSTKDYSEIGSFNPHVKAIIAYNTDSRVIPTIRFNGVLISQIAPTSGRISGQSAVVRLDAWNWEDASIRSEDGMYISWPVSQYRTGWWAEPGGVKENDKYESQVSELRNFFKEAKAYGEHKNPYPVNQRLQAMKKPMSRQSNTYIRANGALEILAAIAFAREYNLKAVIVGGMDSWLVTKALRENNIPVILSSIHSLPRNPDDDVDLPYKTPKILEDSGVLYCLSLNGAWEQRNLMFTAGTAAANGLDKELAIRAITLNAAKILGIQHDYGSLVVGKSATMIISEGDVLNMKVSNLSHAFIDGKSIDLGNKQVDLYQKFRNKYIQEGAIAE